VPHTDGWLVRWVRALAAEPGDGNTDIRPRLAPASADFTPRLLLALGTHPLPPPRRLPPPVRPNPHWLPGLLTTLALVLICLTTATAQGVLPAPWADESPSGRGATQERWTAAGRLRLQVGAGGLLFAPSDRRRLLAVGEGGVEAWDVADAARPRRASVSRVPGLGAVSAVGVDADGRAVLATCDGQLVTWEAGLEVPPWLESTPEVGDVKALRQHAESLGLVVRRSQGLTVLQEATADGGGFMTTASFPEGAHAAQFSPDGNTLALADDLGNVQLWDLSRNYEPTPRGRALNTGARRPRAVAFSADAALLAVIGEDEVVRLWDIRHPERPRHLGSPAQLPARSVAFSADARLVATAGADGRVSLWWR